MEEKKLNIEETIKALECCERGNAKCSACPRNISGNELRTPDCRDELRKQALDVIYCLQEEVLRKDCNITRLTGDHNRKKQELKAEIDRLTEENEHLDMVAKQALADYQNAQVQVDECKEILERRAVNNFAWEAGKIVAELESIKPTVRETYGGEEQVGVDIAINRIKTMVKSKGVEVE